MGTMLLNIIFYESPVWLAQVDLRESCTARTGNNQVSINSNPMQLKYTAFKSTFSYNLLTYSHAKSPFDIEFATNQSLKHKLMLKLHNLKLRIFLTDFLCSIQYITKVITRRRFAN